MLRQDALKAAGCFWCVEEAFDAVEGVVSTTWGFTGGRIVDPTYEQVSAGGTGHAEVVRFIYQDYYKKNPLRYRFYKTSCGRERRLEEVWGDEEATPPPSS